MSVQMMKALLGHEPFEKLAMGVPGADFLERVAFVLAYNEELGATLQNEVPWA
jgi:hypothetical protein